MRTRTGKLVVAAFLVALAISGAAYAAQHTSHTSERAVPRWQRISNCFAQRNWIVSVDTPSGGYAYNRGAGVHFQQWVAWWVIGHRPGHYRVSAADSGLLTSSQVTAGQACVGVALDH